METPDDDDPVEIDLNLSEQLLDDVDATWPRCGYATRSAFVADAIAKQAAEGCQ